MNTYRVSANGPVGASASRVYSIISDYRRHHPHIVPPEYFTRLDVLEGGVGAGTHTRVEMQLLGKKQVFEQMITEPDPGHILMEANTDGSAVTTFTIDARGDDASHVTITTDFPRKPGLRGVLERFAVSLLFPRIYSRELARLAQYADGLRPGADPGQRR